jgi:hypothetical protein
LLAAADAARRLRDSSSAEDLDARTRHVVGSLAESITELALRQSFPASKPIRDIKA